MMCRQAGGDVDASAHRLPSAPTKRRLEIDHGLAVPLPNLNFHRNTGRGRRLRSSTDLVESCNALVLYSARKTFVKMRSIAAQKENAPPRKPGRFLSARYLRKTMREKR